MTHNENHGPNPGPVVQAGSITGDVNINGGRDRGPGLTPVAPPFSRLKHGVHGRPQLVRNVIEAIRSPQVRLLVLHGAGGFGKTTAALRVAQAVEADTLVWWVDASSETTLSDALREVALQAGAKRHDVQLAWKGGRTAPEVLWNQLNKLKHPWLLVFDNADDPRALEAPQAQVGDSTGWLRTPKSDYGSVLATSRDSSPQLWGPHAAMHPVSALSPQDGARMLLDRAPMAGSEQEAGELAERLGGLPLALHLAGSYLAFSATAPPVAELDMPRDFASYTPELNGRLVDLTDEGIPNHGLPDRQLLSKTWGLSLDLLERQGFPEARTLLQLFSCLEYAVIPYELLRVRIIAGRLIDGLTAKQFLATLESLRKVGLIEPMERSFLSKPIRGFALHPVVRDISRLAVSNSPDVSAYAHSCMELLRVAYRDEETDPAVQLTAIPLHADGAARFFRKMGLLHEAGYLFSLAFGLCTGLSHGQDYKFEKMEIGKSLAEISKELGNSANARYHMSQSSTTYTEPSPNYLRKTFEANNFAHYWQQYVPQGAERERSLAQAAALSEMSPRPSTRHVRARSTPPTLRVRAAPRTTGTTRRLRRNSTAPRHPRNHRTSKRRQPPPEKRAHRTGTRVPTSSS